MGGAACRYRLAGTLRTVFVLPMEQHVSDTSVVESDVIGAQAVFVDALMGTIVARVVFLLLDEQLDEEPHPPSRTIADQHASMTPHALRDRAVFIQHLSVQ